MEAWIHRQPKVYPQDKIWPLAKVAELRGGILMRRAAANDDLAMLDCAADAIQHASDLFEKMGFGYKNVGSRINLAIVFHRVGEFKRAEELYQRAGSDAREHARTAIAPSSVADLSRPLYTAHQQLAFLQARRGALYEAVCTLEGALALTLQRTALLTKMRETLDHTVASATIHAF